MVVRINDKPIKVKEEEGYKGIDVVYLWVTLIGYGCIWYVLDYAAKIFLRSW